MHEKTHRVDDAVDRLRKIVGDKKTLAALKEHNERDQSRFIKSMSILRRSWSVNSASLPLSVTSHLNLEKRLKEQKSYDSLPR